MSKSLSAADIAHTYTVEIFVCLPCSPLNDNHCVAVMSSRGPPDACSPSAMLGPDDPPLSVDPEVAKTSVSRSTTFAFAASHLCGDRRTLEAHARQPRRSSTCGESALLRQPSLPRVPSVLVRRCRSVPGSPYYASPRYSNGTWGYSQFASLGPPKLDKLLLQYVKCAETDTDAHALFKGATLLPPSVKILLRCLAKDDTPSVIGSPASPVNASNEPKDEKA